MKFLNYDIESFDITMKSEKPNAWGGYDYIMPPFIARVNPANDEIYLYDDVYDVSIVLSKKSPLYADIFAIITEYEGTFGEDFSNGMLHVRLEDGRIEGVYKCIASNVEGVVNITYFSHDEIYDIISNMVDTKLSETLLKGTSICESYCKEDGSPLAPNEELFFMPCGSKYLLVTSDDKPNIFRKSEAKTINKKIGNLLKNIRLEKFKLDEDTKDIIFKYSKYIYRILYNNGSYNVIQMNKSLIYIPTDCDKHPLHAITMMVSIFLGNMKYEDEVVKKKIVDDNVVTYL